MRNDKQVFPELQKNTMVGTVTNFVTEQMLESEYNIVPLGESNYEYTIQKNNIKSVIIETEIYETDHPWHDVNVVDIVNKINTMDVNVILVSTNVLNIPAEIKRYPTIIIDPHTDKITYDDNIFKMPLFINEQQFNPMDNKTNIDILYLKVGEPIQYNAEHLEYHKKIKPTVKQANPRGLTREFIKRLAMVIKDSKVLYIMKSNGLNESFYKFLELISHSQNTLVFSEYHELNHKSEVIYTKESQDTVDYIRGLVENRMFWDKHILPRTRHAFLNNSFINQMTLSETLNNGNFYLSKGHRMVDISVMMVTKRKEFLKSLIEDLNQQKHVNLQVILLTHGYRLTNTEKKKLVKTSNFEMIILEESSTESFGNCLNKCIDFLKYDYVIKMDDDDFYFQHFIIDIYIGLKYSNATMAGKNAFFFYLEAEGVTGQRRMDFQFREVREVTGNTMLSKTSILKEYMYSDLSRHVDSDLIIRLREGGGWIYSIHPYDMCVYRASNKSGHTFQVDDSRFLLDAKILYYGLPNQTISTND